MFDLNTEHSYTIEEENKIVTLFYTGKNVAVLVIVGGELVDEQAAEMFVGGSTFYFFDPLNALQFMRRCYEEGLTTYTDFIHMAHACDGVRVGGIKLS